MDVHTYHTYTSDVLSFSVVSYQSSDGSGWRKTSLKESEYIGKNAQRLYLKGSLQKVSLKQEDRPQHNANTSDSLPCANNRITTGSKQHEEVAPICSTTIVCTSILLPLLSLYLRRVWMIRNRYMRKQVVHVPMSRNVTTVWLLTWIPNSCS